MSRIIERNNALALNPLKANIDISVHASDWLWAVFCIMMASAIGLLVLGSLRPVGTRAFHQLAAAICFIASIAYFTMASDLGDTPIVVEFIRKGTLGANWVNVGVTNPTRSIWYVRYVDWVLTTPLLLLELLLATGLPLSEIFTTLLMDEIMIVTGLIGALVASRYKWGFFTFGCAAEFYIWYVLLGPARLSANRLGLEYQKAYIASAAFLSFLWILYPIAWGLADGGNVITPTSEMIFYGILDVIAKPVFCFFHCFAISKLDYARFTFSSGKISDGATTALLGEKGVGNGVAGPRQSTSTAVESHGFADQPKSGANHQPATTTTSGGSETLHHQGLGPFTTGAGDADPLHRV